MEEDGENIENNMETAVKTCMQNLNNSSLRLREILEYSKDNKITYSSIALRDAIILLTEMKKWNSESQDLTKQKRDSFQYNKSCADLALLELNCLLVEIGYIQHEIKGFLNYEYFVFITRIFPGEISEEMHNSFLAHAPPELKDGIKDENLLRLNILRYELCKRHDSLKNISKRREEIKLLESSIFELDQSFFSISPNLETIVEVN
ncbi:hypothetical protein HZS_6282 [Henneguya salminicola]|nr:hypothetical protein HZS_6282 [Henneguya salminicola]